jgi:diguanylate cyclase (GGDEF)-like protein
VRRSLRRRRWPPRPDVGRLRLAAAVVLCGLLLLAGLALTVTADDAHWPVDVEWPVLLALLTVVYYAAHRFSVDFELSRETHSVTLVQLPLALGTLFVHPLVHLSARLAGALALALRQRQDPLKALYNLGAAAFEVGTATLVLGLLPRDESGPVLWVALYVGLLVGDVVGSLVLSAVWRLLGVPVSLRTAVQSLLVVAPVTLVFTALSIVAVSAVRLESSSWVVVLGLAGALGLAYRGHRRVVGQQVATERLYSFVKGLGPLDLGSADAEDALERLRVLLHARRLDLELQRDGQWCRLVAEHDRSPVRVTPSPRRTSGPAGPVRGSVLRSRSGGDDTMVTPLLADTELVGLLTATGRLGAARGFDMGDLRLLETAGAELAVALDRGRLLTDLERSATTDELTGCPNLPETLSRVDALLVQHGGVVLASVTVDSFREVNDTLGHEVGDELLLEVSRRLRSACGDALVGRTGGARFGVAVPSEAAGDPELFGLALRAQVEGTAQVGAVGTHVRLSVGLTSSPLHGSDAATLLRRAETAMHSARHAGGGPLVWEPAYEVQGTRRLAVVMALREALSAGAIGVAYQPKLDSDGSRVTGVEALARWTHPALGAIGPDEFVPLAEASGLVGPLTSTVLRQGLAACQAWQQRAPAVGVSVNVSADTVLDASFITQVAEQLAASGVAPQLLTLELTETVLLQDASLAAERMTELRRLGVKLSVDDFGTGYSSLTYLRGLPVDEVKIDKTFVDGLSCDAADRAVVRAVVDIAHTLGLKVVAEGVELLEQQILLQGLGVDEVQGYLHARPMPRSEVSPWLQDHQVRRD